MNAETSRKTLLIPTDFSENSLLLVEHALGRVGDNEKLHIVLFCGAFLSDSIVELLYFSKEHFIKGLITNDFRNMCGELIKKYDERMSTFRIELFVGHNKASFNNFLEGNKIDEILIHSDPDFLSVPKKCFDTLPYILKSDLTVRKVKDEKSTLRPTSENREEVFPSWRFNPR